MDIPVQIYQHRDTTMPKCLRNGEVEFYQREELRRPVYLDRKKSVVVWSFIPTLEELQIFQPQRKNSSLHFLFPAKES